MFLARYDFRAPGTDPAARRELFARALDQAAYLDQQGRTEQPGWDGIVLSEHHGSTDGYLTSPLTVAAAMAGRTRRIPILVAALLVNLYDPVRLAEDIEVIDQLSAGRVSYTLGLGYRREEYELFGRPWATRAADVESNIIHLLSYPHPVFFYGGRSQAAAGRAARLGLNFHPQVRDSALTEHYREECRRAGREPGLVLRPPSGPAYVFCAEDPDRFWAEYGHHLLTDAAAYRAWSGGHASVVDDGSTTVDALRQRGRYVVLTPDELTRRCHLGEIRVVTTHPMCAGLPEKPSWETLRLICEQVRPALWKLGNDAPPDGDGDGNRDPNQATT